MLGNLMFFVVMEKAELERNAVTLGFDQCKLRNAHLHSLALLDAFITGVMYSSCILTILDDTSFSNSTLLLASLASGKIGDISRYLFVVAMNTFGKEGLHGRCSVLPSCWDDFKNVFLLLIFTLVFL